MGTVIEIWGCIGAGLVLLTPFALAVLLGVEIIKQGAKGK